MMLFRMVSRTDIRTDTRPWHIALGIGLCVLNASRDRSLKIVRLDFCCLYMYLNSAIYFCS